MAYDEFKCLSNYAVRSSDLVTTYLNCDIVMCTSTSILSRRDRDCLGDDKYLLLPSV